MTSERPGARDGKASSGQDLAGLGERFAALFIDWIACLVLTYGLIWLGLELPSPGGVNLATPVIFALYYTVAMWLGSQSLGMAVMRIDCVSATTGGSVGFPRALVRAVLLSLLLPALTALADPYHRGLHDHAAGSVMLRAAKAADAS